jgi:hypothetical protein
MRWNRSKGGARSRVGVLVLGGLGVLILLMSSGTASALGDKGADGRFERRDSFHFTLYQDVDLDESGGLHGTRHFEQGVLRELESAYDALDALVGLRPERKLVVYVWDPSIFDAEFSGLFRFPAAGFYGGAIHIRGGTVVDGRLISVLHHELLHAAFDAEAPSLRLPAWLNEGLAEWFEARALGLRQLPPERRRVLVGAARQDALFPLSALSGPSFGGFGPERAQLAYVQSHGFIDHLVQRYGERKLQAFWSAVLRSRSLERATRRVYRKSLEDLEAEFRASLRAS